MIRKLISILLAISFISFGQIYVPTFAYENSVTIKNPTFLDSAGNFVSYITSLGKVRDVVIENISSTVYQNGFITAVALYRDNKLINCKFVSVSRIDAESSVRVPINMNLPEDITGVMCKVLCLDDLQSLRPISAVNISRSSNFYAVREIAAIEDSYVFFDLPDYNTGGATTNILARPATSTISSMMGLFKFDLGEHINSDNLVSAKLRVYVDSGPIPSYATSAVMKFKDVTPNWDESRVTYNNLVSGSTIGQNIFTYPLDVSIGWKECDITDYITGVIGNSNESTLFSLGCTSEVRVSMSSTEASNGNAVKIILTYDETPDYTVIERKLPTLGDTMVSETNIYGVSGTTKNVIARTNSVHFNGVFMFNFGYIGDADNLVSAKLRVYVDETPDSYAVLRFSDVIPEWEQTTLTYNILTENNLVGESVFNFPVDPSIGWKECDISNYISSKIRAGATAFSLMCSSEVRVSMSSIEASNGCRANILLTYKESPERIYATETANLLGESIIVYNGYNNCYSNNVIEKISDEQYATARFENNGIYLPTTFVKENNLNVSSNAPKAVYNDIQYTDISSVVSNVDGRGMAIIRTTTSELSNQVMDELWNSRGGVRRQAVSPLSTSGLENVTVQPRENFSNRDSDVSIEVLGSKFFKLMDLDKPEMAELKAFVSNLEN